jgi:DNA-binding transcriptional MocR family regulator
MLHADDDGRAWPSVATIAAECHVNRDTARRALRDLETGGHVIAKPGAPNAPTVYELTYQPRGETARGETARGETRSPRAGKRDSARGETAPKLERSLNGSNARARESKNGTAATPNGAAVPVTDNRGTFLPGTGWVRER